MKYKWEIAAESKNKKLDKKYENEDSYDFDKDIVLVADGVSGKRGGNIASQLAVDQGKEKLRKLLASGIDGNELNSEIERIVNEVNSVIYEKSKEDITNEDMSTTLTLAVQYEGNLHIAGVGDSPAFIFENGRIKRVTKDDSYEMRKVKEGATEEELMRRMHSKDDYLIGSLGVEGEINVQTYTIPLENVEYVVLMTDGVSKLVAPTELETILQEEKSPEAVISRVMDIVSNPQKVAGMIGRDVKKLANLDDATIIIIKSYKEG